MKKLLFIAVLITALLFGIKNSAVAHVLIRDSKGDLGAIVHIMPDDDPVAGQPAEIFFDIQGDTLGYSYFKIPEDFIYTGKISITDENGRTDVIEIRDNGSAVVGDYIFPRQGVYKIDLHITSTNGKEIEFTHNQRVERGVSNSPLDSEQHSWAEAGLVGSLVATAGLSIVGFNNRKRIAEHSKREL